MAEHPLRDGLTLLTHPSVGRMFVAYLVSYTGTAMAPIAMAFGVLNLTGSTADASFVIAAPTLAAIGVLLIGGAVADRYSRHKTLYLSDLLSMASQLTMAWLFLSAQATVPLLTVLMLVNGIAVAFHQPAAAGFIIQLVAPKDLQATNALLGAARNGAVAGGAALGGILVATIGAGATLLVDAATFALSALLVYSLKPNPQKRSASLSLLEDLRLGWREFSSHTWLWAIVLQFSLVFAAYEAVLALVGPAVAREQMGGARDWGFIVAGFGIGTLAGGLLGMRIMPRHPMRFGTICVFSFSLLHFALALPPPVWLAMLAACIAGAAGQLFAVLWYTTLQRKVPGEMLSRVSAYDHLGSISLAPLGIVAGGYLYEALGYRPTLMIAALAVIVPTALVLCVRDVRQMTLD
ncbi:MAG TPA: MFS transporter [Pseudomonadales bacterium]